ncbi:hypothetical protein ACLOJK_039009, partial [Asimina triloba]
HASPEYRAVAPQIQLRLTAPRNAQQVKRLRQREAKQKREPASQSHPSSPSSPSTISLRPLIQWEEGEIRVLQAGIAGEPDERRGGCSEILGFGKVLIFGREEERRASAMDVEGLGFREEDRKQCSICLECVVDGGERSVAKLQCGHDFHLGMWKFLFFLLHGCTVVLDAVER